MQNDVKPRSSRPNFRVGEPVPEVTFLDETGQAVTLSSLWQQGPLLLALVRHYG